MIKEVACDTPWASSSDALAYRPVPTHLPMRSLTVLAAQCPCTPNPFKSSLTAPLKRPPCRGAGAPPRAARSSPRSGAGSGPPPRTSPRRARAGPRCAPRSRRSGPRLEGYLGVWWWGGGEGVRERAMETETHSHTHTPGKRTTTEVHTNAPRYRRPAACLLKPLPWSHMTRVFTTSKGMDAVAVASAAIPYRGTHT